MPDNINKIDKYEIIEEIGRGGMAIVYKCLHPFLEEYVAVKILPEYFVQDKEFVDRFTREAKTMMLLRHNNIVRIYDAGIFENKYFIVMEYINGKTLKELIKKDGKINLQKSLNIIMQASEALQHAHKHAVIHRDIKPSNILIENETEKAYITDFGIAKAVSGTKLTQTGVSLGTPEYMSPEQFSETSEVDQRTDIYSLGIVFYEMLTGDIPFKGDTPLGVAFKHVNTPPTKPRIKNPKISPYLEKIILKMLAKDPDHRYSSISDLIKDLKNFQSGNFENISANSYEENEAIRINIISDPQEAKVYIDGEYLGKTPIMEKEVNRGRHRVILIKPFYKEYEEEVNLPINEKTYELSITLQREPYEETIKKDKDEIQPSESPTIKEKLVPEELPKSEGATNRIEDALADSDLKERKKEKERVYKGNRFRKLFMFIAILLLLGSSVTLFILRSTKNSNSDNLSYITVSSNPVGAEVYVDGVKIGITPLKDFKLETGSHEIVLKKESFEDAVEKINSVSGENRNISVDLKNLQNNEKKEIILTINSTPGGAKVYINNKLIGETPIDKYSISQGNYSLKVTKEGYVDANQQIVLNQQDTSKKILITLEKQSNLNPVTPIKTGILAIYSNPTGAKVYIDGNYKGVTPLTKTMDAGTYEVTLKKEGYNDYSTYVKVNEGSTAAVNRNLVASVKLATLNIYTDPAGAEITIDDKIIGNSPITGYKIPIGVHNISVQKEGYMKNLQSIELKEGERTLNIVLTLKP